MANLIHIFPLGKAWLCHDLGGYNGGDHYHQHHPLCHRPNHHPQPLVRPHRDRGHGCLHIFGGGGSLVRPDGKWCFVCFLPSSGRVILLNNPFMKTFLLAKW